MCGIAGLLGGDAWRDDDIDRLVTRMTDRLQHRGPDSSGRWVDPEARIALGHRRLAIVDLSPAGHQPMASPSGRYQIVYNGEIYNFLVLKQELMARGYRFRGGSDTEVLLALIEDVGLENALPRLVGMFAIALWDRETRTLHLVRDAVGKKPLYVAAVNGGICFASELKALTIVPGFARELDETSVQLMLRRQYIPAPHAIWRNTMKVPAGMRLEVKAGDRLSRSDLVDRLIRWFDPVRRAVEGQADPIDGTDDEILDRLEEAIRLAVSQRMIADVSLGAFLSGGIDSALIVALMRGSAGNTVRTFTAAFADSTFDESRKAEAVARHLGTVHTRLEVTAEQAQAVIPHLPEIADEPFADVSIIPTFLVCKLARAEVTVALSGDGGDESFGGYGRYFLAQRLAKWLDPAPQPLRDLAGLSLETMPTTLLELAAQAAGGRAQGYRGTITAERLRKLGSVVRAQDPDRRYGALQDIGSALAPSMPLAPWPGQHPPVAALDPTHRMLLGDTRSYLPDDVLVKVDRASMAVALEARAPLLDSRVMALAWRMPLRMKLRDGKGKWALRQLLRRHLPDQLIDRGKEGFSVPISDWLRGPLKDWAAGLLLASGHDDCGQIDPKHVAAIWQGHQSAQTNQAVPLWSLLMFRAWQDRWLSEPSASDARSASQTAPLSLAGGAHRSG